MDFVEKLNLLSTDYIVIVSG